MPYPIEIAELSEISCSTRAWQKSLNWSLNTIFAKMLFRRGNLDKSLSRSIHAVSGWGVLASEEGVFRWAAAVVQTGAQRGGREAPTARMVSGAVPLPSCEASIS